MVSLMAMMALWCEDYLSLHDSLDRRYSECCRVTSTVVVDHNCGWDENKITIFEMLNWAVNVHVRSRIGNIILLFPDRCRLSIWLSRWCDGRWSWWNDWSASCAKVDFDRRHRGRAEYDENQELVIEILKRRKSLKITGSNHVGC